MRAGNNQLPRVVDSIWPLTNPIFSGNALSEAWLESYLAMATCERLNKKHSVQLLIIVSMGGGALKPYFTSPFAGLCAQSTMQVCARAGPSNPTFVACMGCWPASAEVVGDAMGGGSVVGQRWRR